MSEEALLTRQEEEEQRMPRGEGGKIRKLHGKPQGGPPKSPVISRVITCYNPTYIGVITPLIHFIKPLIGAP